jgi:hypothetical protein
MSYHIFSFLPTFQPKILLHNMVRTGGAPTIQDAPPPLSDVYSDVNSSALERWGASFDHEFVIISDRDHQRLMGWHGGGR